MKLKYAAMAAVGLAFLTFGQISANAQAPAAPATETPAVTGTVTAVDTTANTVTIHDRRTDSDQVVTVNGDTKYTKVTNVGLAALAVGNIVSIYSQDYTAGATTLTTSRITVLKELPKAPPANAQANQYRPVVGTVATTTPTLTITTPDSTTITVTTNPDIQVLANQPATLADITVGLRVRATGTSDGTTFTAKLIAQQPARQRRPAAN